MEQTQKFCKNCNESVLATRKGVNHILHLLLTVLTFGFWIIIWILACIKIGGWKCSKCGGNV